MRKTLLLLITLLLAAAPGYADLICHLSFDDENLEDSTDYENHGEWVGGAEIDPTYVDDWNDEDAEGLAVQFDGIDDYILLPHFAGNGLPLSYNDAFSVAMWVKGDIQNDMRIFSEANDTGANQPLYNLGTHNTGGSSSLDIYIRNDANAALRAHFYSQQPVFDNTWHHIAYISDNGTVRIYIDGVLDQDPQSFTYDHLSPLTVTTTTIGGILRANASHWFTGVIDEVRLYDHAMTEEEVAELQPPCTEDNDTHCDGMDIAGPGDMGPGLYYIFIADATDESGDPILYHFTADNGGGTVLQSAVKTDNFHEFNLTEGTWTISVKVDDDLACEDDAADSTCTDTIEVSCPEEGDTIIEAMIIDGPEDNMPGTYTVILEGIQDDSGDPIDCVITADNGETAPITQVFNDQISGSDVQAVFSLHSGPWTITASVDDGTLCDDLAEEAVHTTTIEVESLPPALISHWKFDGDTTDETDNGNDGEYFGIGVDPVWVEGFDAVDPGAIDFDGELDIVQLPVGTGLPITANKAYSVCMWVNGPPAKVADVDPAVNLDCRVYSEAHSDPVGAGINPLFNIGTHNNGNINSGANLGCVDIFIRNNNGQTVVPHLKSQMTAFDETWHHIAWVDDNGEAVLYIDGVRDGTNFNYARGPLSANTASIGAIIRDVSSYHFTGMIDDVRVYNYALTPEEILDIVPEPEDCPEQGDTHCTGVTVTAMGIDGAPGLYMAETTGATDDSGDPILYTYTAVNEEGDYFQSGPTEMETGEFFLYPGVWTITATVDDELLCRDVAADASQSTQVTIEGGLVAHLPFDGDLLDKSPNENDGSMVNDLVPTFTEGQDGTENGAIQLNGTTEFVQLFHNSGLPITTNGHFTIAMWVKGPYLQSGRNDRRIFSESSSTSNNPLFNLGTHNAANGANGDASLDLYLRRDDGGATINHWHSELMVFDDAWHHVCWVDRFGQVELYVDGVLNGNNVNYAKPALTVDITTIGGILRPSNANPATHQFEGAIDDVRLYNYAITADELDGIINGVVTNDIPVYTGDVNNDGAINLADAISLLTHLFVTKGLPCLKSADANDDDKLDLADAISILTYQFQNGSLIGPDGVSMTSAQTGCHEYAEEEITELTCENPCQ